MADRRRNGTFAPGNKVAAGRGPNTKRRALAAAMRQELDSDRMRIIVAKLIHQAEAGDLEATKLVFLYAIGRPREEEREPLDIDLPPIEKPEDMAAAALRVVQKIASGDLDADGGVRMLDALRAAGDIDEQRRMQEELRELRELIARHTDLNAPQSGPASRIEMHHDYPQN